MPSRPTPFTKVLVMTGLLLSTSACARQNHAVPPVAASPEPCAHWAAFPSYMHTDRGSPYLGCINEMNLRAMVDEPADLMRGEPLGPADGQRNVQAVESYREGQGKSGQQGGAAMIPTLALSGTAGAP